MEDKHKQMWDELEGNIDEYGFIGRDMLYIIKSIKNKYFPPQLLKGKMIIKYQTRNEKDAIWLEKKRQEIEKYMRDNEMSWDMNCYSDEELNCDPFFN